MASTSPWSVCAVAGYAITRRAFQGTATRRAASSTARGGPYAPGHPPLSSYGSFGQAMTSTSPLVVSAAAGRSGPPRDVQRRAIIQLLRGGGLPPSSSPSGQHHSRLCWVTRVPHHRVASATAVSCGPPGLARSGTPAHPRARAGQGGTKVTKRHLPG
jgi:hypothetical protein